MARKNPLDRIRSVALGTLKDPVGTAGKAVGQARDTVTMGRLVAVQVTKGATSTASRAAGAVTYLVPGRKPDAATPTPEPRPTPATERGGAVPAPESRKVHGDPVQPDTGERVRAAAARSPEEKKAAAAPASSRKAAAKQAAKQSPPKKAGSGAAAKKSAAKKTPAKKSAQQKPVNVTEELGLDPAPVDTKKARPAKKAPATGIDAAAEPASVDVTPADLARNTPTQKGAERRPAATKAPATKAPAKKASAKKAPAKKAPAGKKPAAAAGRAPGAKLPPRRPAARKPALPAEELAAGGGTEAITPVGTRGADVSTNPDTTETDLQQPGTAPLVDSATTNAVASEQAQLSAAADPDKGERRPGS